MKETTYTYYRDSLLKDDNDECYCASGLLFSECCGAKNVDKAPPKGIHIIKNFIPETELTKLINFLKKQATQPLQVIDSEKSSQGNVVFKDDPTRVTEAVHYKKHKKTIFNLIKKALNEHLKPTFNEDIDNFELPNILKYKPGGFYKSHADSDHFDAKLNMWLKVLNRDGSLLIYLNDDYIGGDLTFTKLNYTYKPTAGDLVFFPSHHLYSHQANPVESGVKYAIVSWVPFMSSEKLYEPPGTTARLKL